MPAAFYRHFESMEALGLVLIDESFRSLRDMLRGARAGKLDPKRVIESSVDILIDGVNDRREHWRFIGRERSSGVSVLRYAIRTEIRLITSELAIDLARFPGLNTWSGEDLNILASLFVNSMIVIAEAIEDAHDQAALDEIKRVAVKQLRMIARRRGRLAQHNLSASAATATAATPAPAAATAPTATRATAARAATGIPGRPVGSAAGDASDGTAAQVPGPYPRCARRIFVLCSTRYIA